MNTTATVQTNRQLILDEDLPESFSKRVRVIVMPENDQEFDENAWLRALSQNEVFEFLANEEEDIYTIDDGVRYPEA